MIEAKQIRGARGMLGWSARELALRSGLGLATIQRMETRGTAVSSLHNVQTVKDTLEEAGIVFIPGNGEGPGVRIRG